MAREREWMAWERPTDPPLLPCPGPCQPPPCPVGRVQQRPRDAHCALRARALWCRGRGASWVLELGWMVARACDSQGATQRRSRRCCRSDPAGAGSVVLCAQALGSANDPFPLYPVRHCSLPLSFPRLRLLVVCFCRQPGIADDAALHVLSQRVTEARGCCHPKISSDERLFKLLQRRVGILEIPERKQLIDHGHITSYQLQSLKQSLGALDVCSRLFYYGSSKF